MGSKKYRPLKPREIEKILEAHGFSFKRSKGDHHQWEGEVEGKRRIVTVPQYREIGDPDLLKSIFSQSGLPREKFYTN